MGPAYCRFEPATHWRTWVPPMEVCVPSRLYVHMDETEVRVGAASGRKGEGLGAWVCLRCCARCCSVRDRVRA